MFRQLLGSKSCRASRDGVLLTLHEWEKAFALALCDGILSLVVRSDARCREWFCVAIDEELYPRYQQWVGDTNKKMGYYACL